ncbi:MAG TPA: VOC family protein [Dehalococcoidia bacterium]|nr:VOC family protein [Dehalococcoidia bacterium]
MARIEHIAIFARDNLQVAEFYKSTFGMQEVFRQPAGPSGERTAVYLTDGHINLALLPSSPTGAEGLHHFGFHVDDVSQTADAAVAAGARHGRSEVPQDGRFNEAFVLDPVGARIDLSSKGWATEPLDQAAAAARGGSIGS